MWAKVLWKVATCNCHVQLKSHQAIKRSQKTQTEPEHRITNSELKVSRAGKTRPHSKVNSHFPFYCSVCFLHISPSCYLPPTLARPVGRVYEVRFALLWFFTVSREKNSHFYFFIWAQKNCPNIFCALYRFYDTTSSRSENMIFLAIMTSCKP